jgi:hypothetical protein
VAKARGKRSTAPAAPPTKQPPLAAFGPAPGQLKLLGPLPTPEQWRKLLGSLPTPEQWRKVLGSLPTPEQLKKLAWPPPDQAEAWRRAFASPWDCMPEALEPQGRPKRVSEAALQRCIEDMVAEFGDQPPSRDKRWKIVKSREPGTTYRRWRECERRLAPQWKRPRGRPRR